MNKTILASIIILLTMTSTVVYSQSSPFYNFKVETLEGKEFDFASLKGKKVMIVNTASRCGFTSQYKILQEMYEKYGGENFEIIGFPANNFMHQEPGSNEKIRSFCTANYGVTFPMMAKISVKGSKMHPLYQWLTQKSLNGVLDAPVKWNFQKFLIDEEGRLADFLTPATKPDDPKVLEWLGVN